MQLLNYFSVSAVWMLLNKCRRSIRGDDDTSCVGSALGENNGCMTRSLYAFQIPSWISIRLGRTTSITNATLIDRGFASMLTEDVPEWSHKTATQTVFRKLSFACNVYVVSESIYLYILDNISWIRTPLVGLMLVGCGVESKLIDALAKFGRKWQTLV